MHVDTGMNRLGMRLEEVRVLLGAMDRLKHVEVVQVMSHLACANEPGHPLNARQLERFQEAASLFPTPAAAWPIRRGSSWAPITLRPGTAGDQPLWRRSARYRRRAHPGRGDLRSADPAGSRNVPRGESIGYGATFTATDNTRVAIVAVGYADGVPRAAHPRGAVWFDGKRRPMLGRVSMDLIAIDVTDCDAARPGAMVQIIGPNLPVDDAAAAAGTTAYELLTRIAPRARRVIKGG
jgi:alanine racemase